MMYPSSPMPRVPCHGSLIFLIPEIVVNLSSKFGPNKLRTFSIARRQQSDATDHIFTIKQLIIIYYLSFPLQWPIDGHCHQKTLYSFYGQIHFVVPFIFFLVANFFFFIHRQF